MKRVGYACINMELSKQNIRTGRTMIDRKFKQGGLKLASELSIANARDLIKILEWNEQHDIRLFRLGSELFPRWNHYELNALPDYEEISEVLKHAGDFAKAHNHRITTHPGPFHILGSPEARVVDNSIISLERHSELFDLMGFAPSYENKINIHVGATYNDKPSTIRRWIHNYDRLSDNLKARLVIENDDKASMYSVRDLYEMLHLETGIPITFDYFHHKFNTGDLSEREALMLARETWDLHGVTQCTHYSESRRREYQTLIENICDKHGIAWEDLPNWPTFAKSYAEFGKIREQAHSDFILELPNTYDVDSIDIMIEAKAKEQALIRVETLQKNAMILG
jgi:UV DNA damage endonuclease